MFAFLVALLTTGGLIGLLHAQDVVESLALETDQEELIEGSVDWTNQILTVYGEGIAPEGETDPVRRRLMGFRAAKVEARRNLLEMVGQVHIDARTKVGMSMAESDEIRSRITGIVKGARVMTGSQTETDGLFRIALRIVLRNEFAEAVLPDYAPPDPLEPLLVETDSLGTDSLQVYSPPQPYTGLLVDARGLDLQPSMAPRLVSESGWEIYNAGFADRQDATQMGVVGYDKDMNRAMKSDRLGGEKAHPLIVKAQDVSGLYSADAVIADDEGIWVRMADAEQGFLSQCRVVFLLGPEPVVVDSILVDSLYINSTYVDTTHLEGDEFEFSEQTGARDNPE
jgi:hypothetical protein